MFDRRVHHLAGCPPYGRVYRMWEELGAMPRECVFQDRITQVELPDARVFSVYTNIARLGDHRGRAEVSNEGSAE